MYIVTLINEGLTVEIHNDKEKLLSGSVVKGINTIDTFSFALLPSDVGFNLLYDLKTLVKVYNTTKKRYEFFGRVLYSDAQMSDKGLISKSVVCENYFGYLCDSIQEYVAERNWTVRGLLEHIITTHNSLLESEKHFHVGTVDVEDPNDNLFCGIQRENTWETIKKKLIEVLGGEIRLRVEEDGIWIDYLKQIGEFKTTEIALSRNMKAITRERDPSEYITRLIPLGAKKGEDTEERWDISSVNGGRKYIDDEAAIKAYGIRVGVVEWDDVNSPSILLTKGKAWLVDNGKVPVKYSITSLDLSLLGLDIDDFDIGNTHPIKNALLGIDDTARIIKKTINVSDDTKSTIEVGDKFKTLTEVQQDQKRESIAAIKIIQKVNGDYVAKTDYNQAVRMVNSATEKVQIDGNRLKVQSEKFGLTEDGTLTVRDANVSGRFETTGKRNATTTDEVDVSVTIENGEMFTRGTSTELVTSGAQQIGTGTDYIYRDRGSLRYFLLPWLLEFAYMMSDDYDYTSVGGIRSTYGSFAGSPDYVTDVLEMFGNWHVSGNMTLASGEAVTSDQNKKNTITELNEKYSLLFDKLKAVLFKYNDGTSDRLHIGFIAQQVKQALDEAGIDPKDFAALCIKRNKDGTEEWSLRYSEFIALNTMEIQRMKDRIKELEEKLKTEEGN